MNKAMKFIGMTPLRYTGPMEGGFADERLRAADEDGTESGITYEPPIIAMNRVTGKVEAVGRDVKDMLGRTSGNVLVYQLIGELVEP